MSAAHTPGPWRWELNEKHKDLSLVGGRPQYDLTIIQPIRWGMGNATLFVRDTAHDGMNLLHKLHERRDWITPFPGRAHHASWCAGVTHPDLRLIEAAPDLLQRLDAAVQALDALTTKVDRTGFATSEAFQQALDEIDLGRAAIAKATGAAA